MSDFLNPAELSALGFAHFSEDALVSRRALVLNPANISIGRFARIDAFCILSGGDEGLSIGRNVHIAAHCTVMGRGQIHIGDFAGLSVRCSIFSSNEDYSGDSLTNPAVPERYRNVTSGPVTIGAHSILGAGTVVLPNVTIGESTAVGALSLVRRDLPSGVIAIGAPARVIGQRRDGHRALAEQYLAERD